MTPSLRRKLEALAERREELERLLTDPGVLADNARFRDLSREFAQLEPVAAALVYTFLVAWNGRPDLSVPATPPPADCRQSA